MGNYSNINIKISDNTINYIFRAVYHSKLQGGFCELSYELNMMNYFWLC